jgi:hypothetical protein
MKELTEVLRGLREDKDLKQSDIADIIKTTQQHTQNMKRAKASCPPKRLSSWPIFTVLSTDYILGRTTCREGIAGLTQI